MKKSFTMSIAIAAAMGSTAFNTNADSSPFSAASMDQGYQVAMHHGDKDKTKSKEGKCGEGMCGGAKDKHDGHNMAHDHGQEKAHDGKCGASMDHSHGQGQGMMDHSHGQGMDQNHGHGMDQGHGKGHEMDHKSGHSHDKAKEAKCGGNA